MTDRHESPAGATPSNPTMTKHVPTCLYLEITDMCNMSCPMCVTRKYRELRNGCPLTREEIRDRLLAPLKALGGKHFVVSGGEPMLSPVLKDVLSDAVSLDYDVTLASNILDESVHTFHDIFTILNDARHGFQFSFDSIRKEEMNVMRGGDVYERVVDNVRKISRLRKQHAYGTRLFAQAVLQERNVSSLLETIEFLLSDVGVDGCEIQPELGYSDVTIRNYRTQKPLCRDSELRSKFLTVAKQLFTMAASDNRLLVRGESYANWERFYRAPAEIPAPCHSRNMVMVGPYGDFRGCLFSPAAGNVRDTTLGEYLESRPREAALELAAVCRICINGCS
jgi:MoaA/NifB/PqqE/SkfB family radical SAM enzyme